MQTESAKTFVVVLIVLSLCVVAATALSKGRFSDLSSSNHPTLLEIRRRLRKINPSYGDIPIRESASAYTEDKRVIYLCLKDPDTQTPYGISVLMYVALHEIAHVISKSVGHGPEFRNNFAELLKKATDVGVYDPRYPLPEKYCGVNTGH